MTPAQLATLKAAILADPVLVAWPQGSDGAFEIAAALNLPATPSFIVWRSSLTPELSRKAIIAGAVQLDNLTVGKRDALLYLCAGTLDCTDAALRDAIDNLCGTQNTLKASLAAAEKRSALRIEKIFSTGTGSDASPALCAREGTVTYSEVREARES